MKLSEAQKNFIHHNTTPWNWICNPRPFFNIWICLAGNPKLSWKEHEETLVPGEAVIIFPEDKVLATNSDKDPVHNLAFHLHIPSKSYLAIEINKFRWRKIALRHLALAVEVGRYLESVLDNHQSPSPDLLDRLGENIANIIIEEGKRPAESPIDKKIRIQVQKRKSDRKLNPSLTQLAEEVGLSVSHYSRKFKQLTHQSPKQYFLNYRIEIARDLLATSTIRIEQISNSLGYSDPAFFSKQFKTKTGQSPDQFRNQSAETSPLNN